MRALGGLALLCAASTVHADQLPSADPDDGQSFRVLAFHDVREDVRASFDKNPDDTAIDSKELLDLFTWLQHEGYHPVTLDQVIASRKGGAPLPPRSLVLTFDDGYASAYGAVFPLLKRFQYPAVMALVTSWLDVPDGGSVEFGNRSVPRSGFITWQQAAEMAHSGLVELASHTDALHRGIPGNPQGNSLPAAVTMAYDERTGTYESEAAYRDRIEKDLRRSRQEIESHTGARVRALAWPYGAWNDAAVDAARAAGLSITFSLDDGANGAGVPLSALRRELATYDLDTPDYLKLLRLPPSGQVLPTNRAIQVDLDYVYDPDPRQQEANLSMLLDRILAIGPSSVLLQAYSDPDGDGTADALYFPNRVLPMRADLFSRVAWQLRTRAHVQVYAWLPVSAFKPPPGSALAGHMVQSIAPPLTAPADSKPLRLSPFDPLARQAVLQIYQDLAQHAAFSGVLFSDDAVLSDYEDASPAALEVYRQWGLPGDIGAIRADPALLQRWTQAKTQYLIDFTHQLAQVLRAWHPRLYTARNLYARPMLDPSSELWYAQNYLLFLQAYDYTAVMAMPEMEQAPDPLTWLSRLMQRAADTPQGLDKTLFELQTRDWRSSKAVPDAELLRQFSVLHRLGARSVGYYPDDFLNDQPGLDSAREMMSLYTDPRTDLKVRSPGKAAPDTGAPHRDEPLDNRDQRVR